MHGQRTVTSKFWLQKHMRIHYHVLRPILEWMRSLLHCFRRQKTPLCLSAACSSLLKGSLVVSSRQMPTCKCPRREQQDIPGNSLGCHVFPKSGLWSQDKAACPFPALCLQLRTEGPGASAHSYSGSEPISAACLRGRERKIPDNPLKQLKGWQGTEALSIFRTASALSSPTPPISPPHPPHPFHYGLISIRPVKRAAAVAACKLSVASSLRFSGWSTPPRQVLLGGAPMNIRDRQQQLRQKRSFCWFHLLM